MRMKRYEANNWNIYRFLCCIYTYVPKELISETRIYAEVANMACQFSEGWSGADLRSHQWVDVASDVHSNSIFHMLWYVCIWLHACFFGTSFFFIRNKFSFHDYGGLHVFKSRFHERMSAPACQIAVSQGRQCGSLLRGGKQWYERRGN